MTLFVILNTLSKDSFFSASQYVAFQNTVQSLWHTPAQKQSLLVAAVQANAE